MSLVKTAPSVFTSFPGVNVVRALPNAAPRFERGSEGPRGMVTAAVFLQDVTLRVGRHALCKSNPFRSI